MLRNAKNTLIQRFILSSLFKGNWFYILFPKYILFNIFNLFTYLKNLALRNRALKIKRAIVLRHVFIL